jgi:NTE family protein
MTPMNYRNLTLVAATVLFLGCGTGKVRVKMAPSAQPSPQEHPLSRKVMGLSPVLRYVKCLAERNKSIESESKTPVSDDCTPSEILSSPHYSLSLSGGGYRASLFHYGAINRLNDIGRLHDARMICGISGGSITAALLVSGWNKLHFNNEGVAKNLYDVVGKPLEQLTSHTIDAPVVIKNLALLGHGSKTVIPSLDKYAFNGKLLRDLPSNADAPILILGAVGYSDGESWAFSRDYTGTALRKLKGNDISLAQAVAASGAFPPVLGPIALIIEANSNSTTRDQAKAANANQTETRNLLFVDGGVLDNNALRYCNMAEEQYVSNANNPPGDADPKINWLTVSVRIMNLIHSDAGEARMSPRCAKSGITCWYLNDPTTYYSAKISFGLSDKRIEEIINETNQPTRYKALSPKTKCALIEAGYLTSASALDKTINNHSLRQSKSIYCDFMPSSEARNKSSF